MPHLGLGPLDPRPRLPDEFCNDRDKCNPFDDLCYDPFDANCDSFPNPFDDPDDNGGFLSNHPPCSFGQGEGPEGNCLPCSEMGLQFDSGGVCVDNPNIAPLPPVPGEKAPDCGIDGTFDEGLGVCVFTSTIESCKDQGKVWVGPGLPCAEKQKDGGLLIPSPIPPRSRTKGPTTTPTTTIPPDPEGPTFEVTKEEFCPDGQKRNPVTLECPPPLVPPPPRRLPPRRRTIPPTQVDVITSPLPPVPTVPVPNSEVLNCPEGWRTVEESDGSRTCVPQGPGFPKPPIPQINLGGLFGGGGVNIGASPGFARPFSVGAGPGDTLFPALQAQIPPLPGALLDFIAGLRR